MTACSGSPILARLHSSHPERVDRYAFLDIGYFAPPIGFTAAGIAAMNEQMLAAEGFEPFGYWSLFNETGTGRLIDAHVRLSLCMPLHVGPERLR